MNYSKEMLPFSEPETRNVRYMLEQHPHIQYMIDVHSFHEDILYPWGDYDDQTSKPSMNFSNPKYDDVRGFPEDNDTPKDRNDPDGPDDPDEPTETLYKEYISKSDLRWFKSTGKIIVYSTSFWLEFSFDLGIILSVCLNAFFPVDSI